MLTSNCCCLLYILDCLGTWTCVQNCQLCNIIPRQNVTKLYRPHFMKLRDLHNIEHRKYSIFVSCLQFKFHFLRNVRSSKFKISHQVLQLLNITSKPDKYTSRKLLCKFCWSFTYSVHWASTYPPARYPEWTGSQLGRSGICRHHRLQARKSVY